jgi:hypothetical protein
MRGRPVSTATSLRRDAAEVEPWTETCGRIRPLIEGQDGTAADAHHVEARPGGIPGAEVGQTGMPPVAHANLIRRTNEPIAIASPATS